MGRNGVGECCGARDGFRNLDKNGGERRGWRAWMAQRGLRQLDEACWRLPVGADGRGESQTRSRRSCRRRCTAAARGGPSNFSKPGRVTKQLHFFIFPGQIKALFGANPVFSIVLMRKH
jgi:hypothetical protein